MAGVKALTEINQIAKKQQRRYPVGSTERAEADRLFELSDVGDARTLSDDPTEAEKKRNARKNADK